MTLDDLRALSRYAPADTFFSAAETSKAGGKFFAELKLVKRYADGDGDAVRVMYVYPDDSIALVTDRFRRVCREFEEENK